MRTCSSSQTVPVLFLAAVASALWTGVVGAGTQSGAVIALHAAPHTKNSPCVSPYNPEVAVLECFNFRTDWPLASPCDLYLVVAKGNPEPGVASLSCGILYQGAVEGAATLTDAIGVDVYTWTGCTSGPTYYYPDLSDPDAWPASGAGIRLTWDPTIDCRTQTVGGAGVQAVAGAFYVFAYSPDFFQVTPSRHSPTPGILQVGDCTGEQSTLSMAHCSFVKFSPTDQGCNPCLHQAGPVETSSWSRLKTIYK